MLEPENPTESTSPDNAAPADAPRSAVSATGNVEHTTQALKAAPKKRTRKPAAAKAAPALSDSDSDSGGGSVIDAVQNQAVQNQAVEKQDADKASKPAAARRSKATKKAPKKVAAGSAADVKTSQGETVTTSSEAEPTADGVVSAPAAPAKTTRRRGGAKSSPSMATAAGDSATAPAVAFAGSRAPVKTKANAKGKAGTSAEPAMASGSTTEAGAPSAPSVLFVAAAPVAPVAAAARSRRRATNSSVTDAVTASGDGESSAAFEDDTDLEAIADVDESDEGGLGESAGRRRRRRGRRGRGGRTVDASADSSADASEDLDEDEASAEAGNGPSESEEDGLSASARRRRRRRRTSDSDGAEEGDDPPNTVTHVRQTRGGGGNGGGGNRGDSNNSADRDDDGVRAVKGSTRLEAKRQRRRDGRDTSRRRPPILTEAEFLARRESVDRVMAVRDLGDRTQIAVLEDDILVEHYVTRATSTAYAGNIYLGRVQNVLPSMEAAFVDIGKARNGVLYAGEVNWDAAGIDGKSRAIEKALSSGDTVLVQVTKDPIGQKGARLTSQISLPGRFLVYVPNGAMTGISRKLPDTERTRLKSILKRIVPDEAGVIVRTAAEGASEADLTQDVARLQAQWEAIQAKAASPKSAPQLLYGEPDLAIRVVRDVFNEDFTKLVIQGDGAWETISNYVSDVAPDLSERVVRHVGTTDLFTELRVDEQLTKALSRKVYLPSGGSLVIDRTEAMVVVDVNTGKFVGAGGNLEQTVTRNNLEAAEEIVRQLRLRDVGGIVVIDFIDMVLESNRELVLRRLTECLGRDRTKHQVAEVTSLGLVQMTRKRVGEGLLEAFSEPCEHCRGRGVIVHAEPVDIGVSIPEEVSDDSPKRRNRRGRRTDATPETVTDSDGFNEEQRRAAANAMAAIAAALHPHPADEVLDIADPESGAQAPLHDLHLVPDVIDDEVVDGAAAEAVEEAEDFAGAAAELSVELPSESNGYSSDSSVAQAKAIGNPAETLAVAGEQTLQRVIGAPLRRPRRRAASRPAGPPSGPA